ncbi:hypothetical protein [Microvirga sp. P5_D2]
MSELLLEIQGILQGATQFFADIPFWLAVLAVISPTLISILTRSPFIISLTATLSITCVLLSAPHSAATAQPLTILAFGATFLVACMVVNQRRYAIALTDIQGRLNHMEEMLTESFARIQERANIFDHGTEEARLAFHEAQESFARIRKGFFRIRRAVDAIQASQQSLENAVSTLSSRLDEEISRSTSEKATEPSMKALPFVLPSTARKSLPVE